MTDQTNMLEIDIRSQQESVLTFMSLDLICSSYINWENMKNFFLKNW